MKKTPKNKKRIWLIAAALAAAFAGWVLWADGALELNRLTAVSDSLPGAFSGFRIAHLSDLHDAEFGEGNQRLLWMIEQAAPDMIAITGDIIDASRTDIAAAVELARKAAGIAPCYYVSGNHEAAIERYDLLKSGLEAAGVTVLSNSAQTLERGGEAITVAGIDDPRFYTDYGAEDEKAAAGRALGGLAGGQGYTLLLSHRPELFELYAEKGVDLALTGHAHGGQIRLPLLGGLIAPNQGLWPEYDSGLYTRGGCSMAVSRGLGNSTFPLRFNNRPEVVVIELAAG